MVLYGHRSIVNQVRYNPKRCIIASSGVEKVIKVWQPFESEGWKGSINNRDVITDDARTVFTHEEYLSLLHSNAQGMSHDYSQQSTEEDPRMMAFFDSLVQKEIEAWNSDDHSDSDMSSYHSSDGSSRPTSTQQSDSDSNTSCIATPNGNKEYASINVDINGIFYSIIEYGRGRNGMKFMNRIQWLIASKRKTLKRLALKGSAAQTSRRRKSSKICGRKMPRNPQRSASGWKNSAKRNRVLSVRRFILIIAHLASNIRFIYRQPHDQETAPTMTLERKRLSVDCIKMAMEIR